MPPAIDLKLFLSVFGLVFVAELPDKTAFATLLLAARRHPVGVFVGVAAAFVVQSLIAVSFGTAVSLLPRRPVRLAAGLLFIAFAAAMWLRKAPDEDELGLGAERGESLARTAWTAFVVIFIAEWGDLTQLATANFAASRREPVTIFLAATLALWAVTAIAVAIGHRAKLHLDARLLQRVAALAFCAAGVLMLASI